MILHVRVALHVLIVRNSTGVDSMGAGSICSSRRIPKADIETPLLVPSFSSAVLGKAAGKIHEKLKEHIPMASLISAYDLNYRIIKKEEIWVSDVVFIDSGNHEVTQLSRSKDLKQWTLQMYRGVINSIRPLAKVVLVNYDQRGSLKRQISKTRKFFARCPDYAKCFLYKPLSRSFKIHVPSLVENIALIEPFDILGLTEKELGNSLLTRCQNLLRIRAALNSKRMNVPIHVFGCLDPLSILSYFLCGADIFDGTLWLKFSFHGNIATYINNYAMLERKWSESDSSVLGSTYVLNLNKLTHLMSEMRRYAREYDLNVFRLDKTALRELKDLTNTALLSLSKSR